MYYSSYKYVDKGEESKRREAYDRGHFLQPVLVLTPYSTHIDRPSSNALIWFYVRTWFLARYALKFLSHLGFLSDD